jgi:hypothetical protein
MFGAFGYMESLRGEKLEESALKNIVNNYAHFVEPFVSDGDNNIMNYQNKGLTSHYYFSDRTLTLLFGDSMSGHIGFLGGKGETDSDLGFINSINANGLIITTLLYSFYILLLYNVRHKDFQSLLFLIILTFVLTFKETGFLSSYATVAIFLVYLFQIKKYSISNYEFKG